MKSAKNQCCAEKDRQAGNKQNTPETQGRLRPVFYRQQVDSHSPVTSRRASPRATVNTGRYSLNSSKRDLGHRRRSSKTPRLTLTSNSFSRKEGKFLIIEPPPERISSEMTSHLCCSW